MLKKVSDKSKIEKAFGKIWHSIAIEKRSLTAEEIISLIPEEMIRFEFIDQAGKTVTRTPQEIEETDLLNTSVYLGRLMNVSHDGDRVIAIDKDGNEIVYRAPISNDHLFSLIDDLAILVCRPVAGSGVLLGETK